MTTASENQALNESLFDLLTGENRPEWVDEVVVDHLERIYQGALRDADIFSDWLEDCRGTDGLRGATAIRSITPASIRAEFTKLTVDVMAGYYCLGDQTSKLARARQQTIFKALNVGFRWFMDEKASETVNEFVRRKMREDGILQQLVPLIPISNDELDSARMP